MPERRGRKRKPGRERRRAGEARERASAVEPPVVRASAPVEARAQADAGPLPSTTARVTGLMIAVITAFLAVLMVYQAVSGEASGIDAAVRVAAGVALVVLAVVVGVLSVAPGFVRDWVRRRRS